MTDAFETSNALYVLGGRYPPATVLPVKKDQALFIAYIRKRDVMYTGGQHALYKRPPRSFKKIIVDEVRDRRM